LQHPLTIERYLKTVGAVWYWVTIGVGATTSVLVFTVPESFYPWIYIRNILGVVFVLFLPGFSFVKAFFQSRFSQNTPDGSLEGIMKVGLSIGMSIALISIVGLLLYYSPWGLDLGATVLSLFALTWILATVALIREYQAANAKIQK
jgi:uncharacterized membrane protein